MEERQDFKGKIALVTGSGRGIGRAIALHFAQRGADVAINFFRNRAPAEETAAAVEALGRKAMLVKANVGEVEEIERLLEEVEQQFGGLDILVNNAASGYNRPVAEQKVKGWDWTMDINGRAALFASQQAVPLMEKRGGGWIVNISSAGATRVLPEYVVVGASKAAVEAITRYLAVELAEKNISVNAVSPGFVKTDVMEHFATLQNTGVLERIAEKTPAKRLVEPEEVAELVAFLCTPAAAMIRGQVIAMDGGITLPLNEK